MESNWASEHLQLIRTLMERSALYRRALAPLMLSAGTMGLLGAWLPRFVTVQGTRVFTLYWLAIGIVTVVIAFLLVRRQALRDGEEFWSLPTRRVSQALLPGFCAGFAVSLYLVFHDPAELATWFGAIAWVICYGCALHAAGFFMQRGIRLFGTMLVGLGCLLFLVTPWVRSDFVQAAHLVMGGGFGLLHLAYGVYLFFTERSKPV